jgi:hypothetical protein
VCLSSGLNDGLAIVGRVEASSSRCTATEKRRQKAGSRIVAIVGWKMGGWRSEELLGCSPLVGDGNRASSIMVVLREKSLAK